MSAEGLGGRITRWMFTEHRKRDKNGPTSARKKTKKKTRKAQKLARQKNRK